MPEHLLPASLYTPEGYLVPVPDYLVGLPLPYVRTSVDTQKELPNVEIVACSMRVGKTTGVKSAASLFEAKGIPSVEYQEEYWNNPFLQESYKPENPSQAILASQLWFLDHKYFQTVERQHESKAVFQDASVEMYFCYALTNAILGRLTVEDFEEYRKAFYGIDWSNVHQPDLMVYLKVGDREVVDRARRSARSFETIDESYFLTMSAVNNHWLAGALQTDMNIASFDAEQHDYSQEGDGETLLMNTICQGLHLNTF